MHYSSWLAYEMQDTSYMHIPLDNLFPVVENEVSLK